MIRLYRTSYFLWILILLLYSFTQVDLSLTVSGWGFIPSLQQWFQGIGYFNRSLSAIIFSILFLSLFTHFTLGLVFIKQLFPTSRYVWQFVIVTSFVLLFSYPAFSYDIFNYLFTAKTIGLYLKNPYELLPISLSSIDPWLSFMRWTHLPSAYSPLWIAISVPTYFFGMGQFFLVLFWIKLLIVCSYIVTVYFIGKILERIEPTWQYIGMLLFAANPLVLLEVLVSSHNDSLMLAVASIALYALVRRKRLASLFLLSISVALKTMTIFAFPGFMIAWWWEASRYIYSRWVMVIAILFGLGLVLTQREILGWYWLWVIIFGILIRSLRLQIFLIIISFSLVFQYFPYIYYGNFDLPGKYYRIFIPQLGFLLAIVGCILAYAWDRLYTSGKPKIS